MYQHKAIFHSRQSGRILWLKKSFLFVLYNQSNCSRNHFYLCCPINATPNHIKTYPVQLPCWEVHVWMKVVLCIHTISCPPKTSFCQQSHVNSNQHTTSYLPTVSVQSDKNICSLLWYWCIYANMAQAAPDIRQHLKTPTGHHQHRTLANFAKEQTHLGKRPRNHIFLWTLMRISICDCQPEYANDKIVIPPASRLQVVRTDTGRAWSVRTVALWTVAPVPSVRVLAQLIQRAFTEASAAFINVCNIATTEASIFQF